MARPSAPILSALPTLASVTVCARSTEIEMPWLWQVLRDQVYAQLPRYEQKDRFAMTMSPVVISSPAETTPGVGFAGKF